MRLLLDECIGHHYLTGLLVGADHDVVRSVDVASLGGGATDPAVFAYACQDNRVLITYNNADFRALGQQNPNHPGILLVYLENKPTDMASVDITKAIANVETTFPGGIAGRIESLNGYQW